MSSFMVRPTPKLQTYKHPAVPYNVRRAGVRRVKFAVDSNPNPVVKNIGNYLSPISMAGKSYTKTKKKSNRRRRRGRLVKRIPKAIASPRKIIKCQAVQYVDLANGANGNLSPCYVQLNSCDDPFGANGAGQPLGYDQWKALYKKARIIGTKITAKFHNGGSSATMVGLCPMPVNQSNTSLSDYEYYMENPQCKSRILSPDMDHVVFSTKVSTKKHLALKDIKDNSEVELDLVTETAPTKLAWCHIFAQSLDQTATFDVEVVLKVEYIVLLTDPVIPARSVET